MVKISIIFHAQLFLVTLRSLSLNIPEPYKYGMYDIHVRTGLLPHKILLLHVL